MAITIESGALPAYRRPAAEVAQSLGSDTARGLTATEVRARLERHGPNEIPSEPPVPLWRRFLAQFQNPLTALLLVATAISFAAWLIEREEPVPYEAITILAIVLLNGVLGYVQENRAEQAVAALRAMSAATARALRDGQPRTVATAELVPGDIILLEEGDAIPADGRVLESVALQVAEAALTGESTPVSKEVSPLQEEAGIADQSNMVFSGTAVAVGRGRAVVTATGVNTQIGAIAGSLHQTGSEQTPLQHELDWVGRLLGVAVIAIAVVIGGSILLVSDLNTLDGYVSVLLLAVSLAVAAVPEGLTAITTVVLSLGMQRMARRNVIARKLAAVEALGSTTVICTDKTGTLTKNEMTVRAAVTAAGRVEFTGSGYAPEGDLLHEGRPIEDPALSTELRRLLIAAQLASNATLRLEDGRWAVQGDPTEGALLVASLKFGLSVQELESRFQRVDELPFSSERKMMSVAYADAHRDNEPMVFAKGAPDVLLARCTSEWVGNGPRPLTPERRQAIGAAVESMAGEALRTLGVAARPLPAAQNGLSEAAERELIFLGVVGMIDPPRPEARKSVRLAQAAGVRVIMITGDHPTTATAIARELGIAGPDDQAIPGARLERMDDAELRRALKTATTFARVAPAHKLRIVQALKAEGEIVAMTGDGVNDAPALKTADIGVAMGITGTDVSKEASDMVLTDDNFASIVAAVEEGRSIFANIQKFLRYLLSSNVSEVLVMFLGVVFAGVIGLGAEEGMAVAVPLLATQILWINLLTDAGPALALGVDPKGEDLMHQPPRDPRRRVISTPLWIEIMYIGAIIAVGTLLVADWALPDGLIDGSGSPAFGRTMVFTTLVFYQLFNVFNARSGRESAFRGLFRNRWLWGAIALSAALQVAVVHIPVLQRAFGTVALTWREWLLCLAVGSTVLWAREAVKLFDRHNHTVTAVASGVPTRP